MKTLEVALQTFFGQVPFASWPQPPHLFFAFLIFTPALTKFKLCVHILILLNNPPRLEVFFSFFHIKKGGIKGGMVGKRNEERRVESRLTFPSLKANKVQSLDFNSGFPTVILITSLFRMSKTKLLAIPPMCNFLMPLGRNGSEFCRSESLYSFRNPI